MEVLTSNASLVWLCLIALFAFAELFFLRYRVVWFSVGAVGGLLCSLFYAPFWLQGVIFIFLSVALLWFCRNWARQVRCEDAMMEIKEEEDAKYDTFRYDRNVKDCGTDGESADLMPQDCSVGNLLSGSEERGDVCEKIPYPLSLLDP